MDFRARLEQSAQQRVTGAARANNEKRAAGFTAMQRIWIAHVCREQCPIANSVGTKEIESSFQKFRATGDSGKKPKQFRVFFRDKIRRIPSANQGTRRHFPRRDRRQEVIIVRSVELDSFTEMMIKPVRLLGEKARAIRHRYFDKFVFIHINKTGGSSIKKVLDLPFEHVTALEKIASLGREQWDRRFTFTVIRNPWDKVVSHYHFRLQKKRIAEIEFKDWVKKTYRDHMAPFYDVPKMFMPQTDWISDKDGNILCDSICRFENLKDDFNEVCQRLGKTVFLPH